MAPDVEGARARVAGEAVGTYESAAQKTTFVAKSEGAYGYGRDDGRVALRVDAMRATQFPQLEGNVYLDHAGATMYSKAQLDGAFQELSGGLFANPHSSMGGVHAESTTGKIERVRRQVLAFFSASEEEYTVIFTSGATAALKLVGESFPWSNDSTFAHSVDSHTSVLGIRGYAAKHGAVTACVGLDELQQLETPQSSKTVSALTTLSAPSRCAGQGPMSLFAYPAECNFSGVRHPLSLVDQVRAGRWQANACDGKTGGGGTQWLVLVDAAKYVGTHRLDLSLHHPDFVVLSFYKMFGYPTGLGALLVRKTALSCLTKTYQGGGTVQSILAGRHFAVPRGLDDGSDDSARFADGTQSFLSILALRHGFEQLEKLGMANIEAHTSALTKLLFANLKKLKHWNGRPVCRVYGNHERVAVASEKRQSQGAVVACNFLRSDGGYVGYSEVHKLAEIHNIHLRTGCFCNPGACQHYLGLEETDVMANIAAGHVCGDDVDLVNGLPTGAVRLSLGYMSTFEDVTTFVEFVAKYFVSCEAPAVAPKAAPCSSIPGSVRVSQSKGPYLRKISLFPIKSCAGMTMDAWPIGSRGLLFDREWAIVDSLTGNALSLKNTPELCFVRPVVDLKEQTLTISVGTPGGAALQTQSTPEGATHLPTSSFVLPLRADISSKKTQAQDAPRDMRVCTGACKGNDVGEDVSRWLSSHLGRQCTLVRVSSNHLRASLASRSKQSPPKRHLTDHDPGEGDANGNETRSALKPAIGFANQGQFLLISSQSIEHFNAVLRSVDSSLSMDEDAFRANLIVDGCTDAFEEDQWRCLRIGDAAFDVSGPCSRCSVINLDQRTGQFNRRPLQVLSSYRRERSSIFFGQFLTARGARPGEPSSSSPAASWLRVGDRVVEQRNPLSCLKFRDMAPPVE